MAHTDSDKATAAIIKSTADQFLTGKKSVSRAFLKQAMDIRLASPAEASRILRVQENQVNRAILQTCSHKDLRPFVILVQARASLRCQAVSP